MYNTYQNQYSENNLYFGNQIIIDVKTGDVNGDGIPDTVFLIGEKSQYTFYENIKLVIKDGRMMYLYTIPLLPDYDIGYDPWIILGNFTGSKANDILISMPVGGSGGLTVYYIVSFLCNQATFILTPDAIYKSTFDLGFEVIYKDCYKVDIKSTEVEQTFTLDISYKKQEGYEGVIYDKDGKLIKPINGFITIPTQSYPIQFNGGEANCLMILQDIAGISHADGLGSLVSYWNYSSSQKSWTLIPNMVHVMI